MSAITYIAQAIKICDIAQRPTTTVESELELADAISTLLADTLHDSELQQSVFDYRRLRSTGIVPIAFNDRERARNLMEAYTHRPRGNEEPSVLKSGDIVYLNSGSPPLCVIDTSEYSNKTQVDVTWIDATSNVRTATFDRRMLSATDLRVGK